MKKYIMALDQGTTSSRAIVFDHAQNIVAVGQKEFNQIYPQPGWVEHDPMEIWATQYGVLQEALIKAGITMADVAGIGITNQRETTIVWEKATGQKEFETQIKRELLKRKTETVNISIQSRARDVFFNFTYVPVYVNTFKYRNKLYKLFVSGTTGKVVGKTPVSTWSRVKNLLKVLGIGAILAGILYLFKK